MRKLHVYVTASYSIECAYKEDPILSAYLFISANKLMGERT